MFPYYYPYNRKNIGLQAPSPSIVAPITGPHAEAPMPQPTPTMQPLYPVQQQMMPMQPVMPVCPQQMMPMQPVCPYLMASQMMPGMDMMDNVGGMDEMMDGDVAGIQVTSDPPPVLSNNPASASVVLFKELTGFPNYGNPSGNADILYTGNRGVWTFDIPPFLFVPGNLRAQLLIRAVLDDHVNVPVRQYSARITINNETVHNGPVPLPHGTPTGQRFTNWQTLTFNITNLRRSTRVVIVNTSTAGANDWIAFDWMELRMVPR